MITGFDQFCIVLKDQKPIISCFTNEENLCPVFYTEQLQLTKFELLRIVYTDRKNLTAADFLGCSFTQKQLQLSQLKPKQFSPQNRYRLQQRLKLNKSNLYTVSSNMKLNFLHKKTILTLF